MPRLDAIQMAAREQFSRQSHQYGNGHILENVEDVAEAASYIALSPGFRILDVACGAGHTGLYFSRLGYEVTFGDISSTMLERVRETADRDGLSIHMREHPAEELPYPDNSFDLVTCRIAPHHFSSPVSFVKESSRVLKSGGYFLMIDGTIPEFPENAGEWLNRLEKWRDPSHARLLTPQEWKSHCQGAGFEIFWTKLSYKKQPNLEWYFQAAATPLDNQANVRKMIDEAPEAILEAFEFKQENDTITWQWPILSLLARKLA